MTFSLDMFEDENFREFIRDNFIVYKENNGIKVVDEEYTQNVLNTDPIQVIENYLKEQGQEFSMENNFPQAFVAMKFNGILKEEISKANADTYRGQSINDYLSVVDRLGFQTIYDKTTFIKDRDFNFESEDSMKNFLKEHVSPKTEIIKTSKDEKGWVTAELNIPEREIILYHPDHNMLLHVDTYQGHTINSATLSFNVENRKNKHIYDAKLPLSGGFAGKDCNKYVGSIDAIDMLGHKMTTLLTYAKPLEKWIEFDERFYSHITHKNVEIGDDYSWDSLIVQKMEHFPEHILTSLLEDNIKIDTVQKHFHQKYNMDNDFEKMNSFLENLSVDEEQKMMAHFFVAGDFHAALSNESLQKLSDLSIDKSRFEDYDFLIERKLRSDGIQEEHIPFEFMKEAVEKSSINDVKEGLKENKIKFKLFPKLNDIKDIMEDKLKSQHKNKNKLH